MANGQFANTGQRVYPCHMSATLDAPHSAPHSHEHVETPPSRASIAQNLVQAERVCERAGRRFTDLRKHIYELILADGGAVKAYDLLDRLKPERGSPKPPTVYRALDFLSELGLVHRVEALNAYIACDPHHEHCLDERHVAEFFVCECCKSVSERHAGDHGTCAPDGFAITRSVIEHYGTCAFCSDAHSTA